MSQTNVKFTYEKYRSLFLIYFNVLCQISSKT